MVFGLFSKQVDPICGMKVSKDSQHKSEYNGKTYYFCALNCKQAFDKNPEKYAK